MKETLKKLFLILLMLAVVVTLAGCGDKDEKDKDDDDDDKKTSQTDKKKDNDDDDTQSAVEDGDKSSSKSSNDKVTISKEIDGAETTLEFNYKNNKIDTVKMTLDVGDSEEANAMLEMFEGLASDPELKKEFESQLKEQGIIDFSTSGSKLVMELNSKGLESMDEDLLGDSSISDITSLTPDELRKAAKEEGFTVE